MNGITNDLLEPTPSTSYGFMLLVNNDKIPFLDILCQSSFLQANFPSYPFCDASFIGWNNFSNL